MDISHELHTIREIFDYPDGQRAELIDGFIYNMAPPNRIHQRIVSELTGTFSQYIRSNKGTCQVYAAPFAVFLNNDDYNYVEPDISIICDTDKLDDKGCNGAPDFVAEVVSPSSKRMDYILKLMKYRSAGVREYWIIDPENQRVLVYLFGDASTEDILQYSFEDSIPVHIYDSLTIRIADYM